MQQTVVVEPGVVGFVGEGRERGFSTFKTSIPFERGLTTLKTGSSFKRALAYTWRLMT